MPDPERSEELGVVEEPPTEDAEFEPTWLVAVPDSDDEGVFVGPLMLKEAPGESVDEDADVPEPAVDSNPVAGGIEPEDELDSDPEESTLEEPPDSTLLEIELALPIPRVDVNEVESELELAPELNIPL